METSSHHANLIVSSSETDADLIKQLEKRLHIKRAGNPDFTVRRYANFTIDEARELRARALARPMTDSGLMIFLLMIDNITIEAQNALLKLLEEPPEYARFYLRIPSSHLLLPTLRSRLNLLDADMGTRPNAPAAAAFIKASPSKRLAIVKSFVDDISKDKKTKRDAVNFLDDIQRAMYSGTSVRAHAAALEIIETARTYMTDRAPSIKMLLEYVALAI
ncbi:MAG: hypothetical protein KGI59_01985 [Patescibacteria group bacterium]|nr:hypothetical protein [Patescibacteria group bacterium]MDE2172623.1 hypothetical protein [Patescibacteria group bacterium]